MDKPELYNKVATKLYVQFGIRSAEIVLLCTFIVNEFLKDGNQHGDKRKNKIVS